MEINKEHIQHIKTSFANMRSKAELLALLNYVKPIVYGEESVPFELKQITYYANPKLNKNRYLAFEIKKKSGAARKIHAPVPGLKAIQRCLNFILQVVYEPHPTAHGFVLDKSIVDNAKIHVNSNYVYNIDLKDFFPSIDQARVWKTLQLPPFNLGLNFPKDGTFDVREGGVIIDGKPVKYGNSVNLLFAKERLMLNNIICALVCHEMEVERLNEKTGEWEKVIRNVLPQGAPTSPTITNIVCRKLDFKLNGVAKRFNLKYSRYADDITFSSMHSVFTKNSPIKNDAGRTFLEELNRVITEQNFHIKESKVRLQRKGYRQEVTGLNVNEKVNVQRRYIKKLRVWLHRWELFGYEMAEGKFLRDYLKDRGHLVKGKPHMTNVIDGKLMYLEMVKGKEDSTYRNLKRRFDLLVAGGNITKEKERENLNEIFAVLKSEGLTKAREKYPL